MTRSGRRRETAACAREKRVPHEGHSDEGFRIRSSIVVRDSRLDTIAWRRRIGSGRSRYTVVDCVRSGRPSDRAPSNERETKGGERAASTAQRRCGKNEKQPEKKEWGICGEGEDSRGRKRRYDRAFLVASIHVSSVTRVMSYVKEIRGFSSQAGTVLPFRLLGLSLSLSLLSPFPSAWLVPRRYLLLSIGMYARGKQSVCLRGRRQRA